MRTNDTDQPATVIMTIQPGGQIPEGAAVLDEDNPHVCIYPEGENMRCPACEMQEILGVRTGIDFASND